MFRQSGCTEGNPPSPISVGVTGNFNSSAKASSASAAPELTIPPPTYITGRSAFMIAAAAVATARGSGGHLRSTNGKLMFFKLEYEVRAAETSLGMSITIGQAGPVLPGEKLRGPRAPSRERPAPGSCA